MIQLLDYLNKSRYYYICYLRAFFFNDPATTEIYTLSLHDALPISREQLPRGHGHRPDAVASELHLRERSDEHTSELQSRVDIVCRLLLEQTKEDRSCPAYSSAPERLSFSAPWWRRA